MRAHFITLVFAGVLSGALQRFLARLPRLSTVPLFLLSTAAIAIWDNDWPVSTTPDEKTLEKHRDLRETIPDWLVKVSKEESNKLKPVPKTTPGTLADVSSQYHLALFDTITGNSIPLWGSVGGKKTFGHQSRQDDLSIPLSPRILSLLLNQRASLNSNWFYVITDYEGTPVRFLGTLDDSPEGLPGMTSDESGQQAIALSNTLPSDGQPFIGITNVGAENPTVIAINPLEASGTAIISADIIRQLQSLPEDQKDQLVLVTGTSHNDHAIIHRTLFSVNKLSTGGGYISHHETIFVSVHDIPHQLTVHEYFEQRVSSIKRPTAQPAHPLQSPLGGTHRVELAIQLETGGSSDTYRKLKDLPPTYQWYGDGGLYPEGEISLDAREIDNLCTSKMLGKGKLVIIEHQPVGNGYRLYVHQPSLFPLQVINRSLTSATKSAPSQSSGQEKFQLPPLTPNWKPGLPTLDPDNAITTIIKAPNKKAEIITKTSPGKSRSMTIWELPAHQKEPAILPDEEIYTPENLKVLQQGLAQKKRDKDLAVIAEKLKVPASEMIAAFGDQGIRLTKTSGSSSSDTPSGPSPQKPTTPNKKSSQHKPQLSKTPQKGSSKKATRSIDLPTIVTPSTRERHSHWQNFKADEQKSIAEKMKAELNKHGELPVGASGGGSGGGDVVVGPPGGDGESSDPMDLPDDDPHGLARYIDQHPAEQAVEFVQGRLTRYPLYTLATLFAASAALELYHSWNLYPGPRETLIRKTLQAMGPGASAFEHEALRMLVEGTPEHLLEYWGSDTLNWWVTQSCQHWCSRNNCSASFIPDIFLHYILSPVSTRKDRFLKEIRVRVSLEPLDLNNPWLATVDRRRKGYAAALDFNPVTQQYWMARLNDRGLLQETSNLMYTVQIPVKVMRFSFLENMMVKSQHNRFKEIIPHPVTDATNQYRPVVPYPMERQRYGVYTCVTLDGDKWRAIDINGQEPGYYGVPAVIGYAHKAVDGYCVPSTMDKWLSVLGSDGQTSLLNPEYEPSSTVRLDLRNTFKMPKEELNSKTCRVQFWKERRWKTAPLTDLNPGSVEAQLPAHGFYRVRCQGQTATFTKDNESGMLFVWSWPRTALTPKPQQRTHPPEG